MASRASKDLAYSNLKKKRFTTAGMAKHATKKRTKKKKA